MAERFRLTREVRFGIDARAPTAAVDGRNGHAGRPALTGIGHFFTFRLTIEGKPDAASGYLRNIKDIDGAVRKHAVPALASSLDRPNDQRLAHNLVTSLRSANALPGAEITGAELALSPFLVLGWCREDGPNMIRLSQKFEFSAAHRLHSPQLTAEQNVATFGKCNNPHGHGHNYELQVTVTGQPDSSGVLLDVGRLERLVEEHVITPLDHKHLNIEVPEFATINPSVEHIAMVIYRRLAPAIRSTNARLASVTVWETPKTWCEYSE